MMATTHAFAGLAMAVVVAVLVPDLAVPAALGGILGGVFPDLDLAAAHRKTLHFPMLYWVPAVAGVFVLVVAPSPAVAGGACFFLAAAVHAAGDALGGGLEPRPWEGRSDRGVYSHLTGRWVPPQQWVRYDGAPEDFVVGAALAVPGLVVFDGPIRTLTFLMLGVSLVYAAVRKPLGELAARI